ncbi:MAG: hypothetical protein JW774_07700 [Candidatus Aureabacteria bacterium]|nr:hypothetical protein [Candidatus Auribacterota bacterium]
MKQSKKPFIISIMLSLLVHFQSLWFLKEFLLKPAFPVPDQSELLLDLTELPEPEKKYFIDTPEQPVQEPVESENISDKNSRTDSSQQGKETGVQPLSKDKDLFPQAPRYAPMGHELTDMEQIRQFQQAEKKIEKEEAKEKAKILSDKTSLLEKENIQGKSAGESMQKDPEEQIAQLQNTNVSLTKANGPSAKEDIFPLPMISLGERTLSDFGLDSFNAEESEVGKYFKVMRDKIGLKFHQMVFFHYRTNYIFGSRVNVKFDIKSNGMIDNLQTKLISGDPLFEKYCETVVRNAAPFVPLYEKLKPYMEEGVLKMDILFGYDVRESKGK